MSDTEIISKDVLVCPYCNYEDESADGEMDSDEWIQYECGNCGKYFYAIKKLETIFKSDILN